MNMNLKACNLSIHIIHTAHELGSYDYDSYEFEAVQKGNRHFFLPRDHETSHAFREIRNFVIRNIRISLDWNYATNFILAAFNFLACFTFF